MEEDWGSGGDLRTERKSGRMWKEEMIEAVNDWKKATNGKIR